MLCMFKGQAHYSLVVIGLVYKVCPDGCWQKVSAKTEALPCEGAVPLI